MSEELTPDEWDDLMSVGENHGRRKGEDGGWNPLDFIELAVWEENLEIAQGLIHGSRTTYVEGCRCRSCKRANRDYHRKLRAAKLPDPNP